MPFSDRSFDVAWTEHVQMNIEDKAGFYREIGRVLRPGGQLAFHDIFAGVEGALHFPVPWAADRSINHLIGVEEAQKLLADLGFEPVRWEEKSEASIAFFRAAFRRLRTHGRPAVGLHLLMGDDATEKFGNMLRNLEEGRLRVMQAVMRRVSKGGADDG
jgi:SAM-dependent methyltransferase